MQQTPKLKPCPDCGHQVSKDAATCPQCGRKFHQEQVALWMLLGVTIIGMAILLVIVVSVMHQ
jgi:RNA polymerase subunit RPABC4/transcription elongation factor Spt4